MDQVPEEVVAGPRSGVRPDAIAAVVGDHVALVHAGAANRVIGGAVAQIDASGSVCECANSGDGGADVVALNDSQVGRAVEFDAVGGVARDQVSIGNRGAADDHTGRLDRNRTPARAVARGCCSGDVGTEIVAHDHRCIRVDIDFDGVVDSAVDNQAPDRRRTGCQRDRIRVARRHGSCLDLDDRPFGGVVAGLRAAVDHDGLRHVQIRGAERDAIPGARGAGCVVGVKVRDRRIGQRGRHRRRERARRGVVAVVDVVDVGQRDREHDLVGRAAVGSVVGGGYRLEQRNAAVRAARVAEVGD